MRFIADQDESTIEMNNGQKQHVQQEKGMRHGGCMAGMEPANLTKDSLMLSSTSLRLRLKHTVSESIISRKM